MVVTQFLRQRVPAPADGGLLRPPSSADRNGVPPEITESRTPTEPPEAVEPASKPAPTRLLSLDAFRGLTILGMLLVNNIALGAHTPAQFQHAEWSGAVHIADVVFPWFLFIVGVAVPYSAASARRKHLQAWQYDLKALYRALALIVLGCVIDGALAKHLVIGLGVLQIIGLAYFCAVLVGGVLSLPGRLGLAGLLLVAHWAIIHYASVPGQPAGHFGPNDNAIDAINRLYLERWHLSGLLSVLPTTAMVLIGTAAGDLVRRKKVSAFGKFGLLELSGAGLTLLGLLWSVSLPMNKPLWTASYILYTAGLGCIGLGLMYLLIDAPRQRWGARAALPLLIFGSNAITAYVAPILTKAVILRNITVANTAGGIWNGEEAIQHWFYAVAGRLPGGCLYTAAYILFWWVVLAALYKKRWFLRV